MKNVIPITLLLIALFPNASCPEDSTGVPASIGPIKKTSASVPVGTVIAWPVATDPPDMDRWLECNGQSISAATYPELHRIVGSSVPDYRGYFLRGIGGNSAELGVEQGDAIRNITGSFISRTDGRSWSDAGAFYSDSPFMASSGGQAWLWGSTHFDASRIVPTANENRPVNKAIRYLIKAKN